MNGFGLFFSIVAALATVVIAWNTVEEHKLNAKMKDIQDRWLWLTGCMESHSELMLRLEAKKQDIPVIWWDFSVHEAPNHTHGDKDDINEIKVGVPLKQRKNLPMWAA